jgi:hypothetical protein
LAVVVMSIGLEKVEDNFLAPHVTDRVAIGGTVLSGPTPLVQAAVSPRRHPAGRSDAKAIGFAISG